jgi:hypothetical protein
VSIKNHTKTLSTTPSAFENPFLHPLPLPRPLKESLSSSKEELQPSHAKSQKTAVSHKLSTAVSHKLSHNSSKQAGERLRTENNSQPLSTVNYGVYDDYS